MEQIKEIQAYLCERIAAVWNELLIQVSWLAERGWSKVEALQPQKYGWLWI